MKKLFVTIFLFFIIIFPNLVFASNPLVSVDWLKTKLNNDNIKILDIRNKIDNGGIELFLKGHIPGSIHTDYLKEWKSARKNSQDRCIT